MKFDAPNQAARRAGLTLVEGLVILAILAVAAALYLPALARTKTRTKKIGCVNQLKQVGLAHRLWSNDHHDEFPFFSPDPDGSRFYANTPQVFRHYQALSNELVTPKILVCPQDLNRRPPKPDREGVVGFQNLSNTNLSYFVGLDAREDDPRQMLSGDRNITGGTWSGGFLRTLTPRSEAGWTAELHQFSGNVGLADGSVQQLSTNTLRQHLAGITNTVIRFAVP